MLTFEKMEETIRLLSIEDMFVVHKIIIPVQLYPYPIEGAIIYKHHLTSYPCCNNIVSGKLFIDELDTEVLNAVKVQFPNARYVHDTFFFSVDINKFVYLTNYGIAEAHFCRFPDTSDVDYLQKFPNGFSGMIYPLSIYYLKSYSENLFNKFSFISKYNPRFIRVEYR